jgi:hypothetical protein
MGLGQQEGKGGEEGNKHWNDFWNGIANINPGETVTALPFIKSLIDLFTETTSQQDTSNQNTQSKQEEIKQQLKKEIEKDAPAETETNTQELLEHKVKKLSTIFFELKYQKIDEILQKTTSTTYAPKDKIDEVKKFQNKFKLDLPINSNDELDRALRHLSSDITTENLSFDLAALSTKKFTPISYTLPELQYHSIHSKHYLDGILQVDEIDAEKRITASKLFVKQLELVSKTQKSAMAGIHKQFVQYKVEEFSYDTKKIVAAGAEFAKSIEALTSGDKPTSFLGADGRVLTGFQGEEYHFHDSVVKDEVHQRDLVIRKFKERLSSLSSALGSKTKIDKAKTDKIFENTKLTYERGTNKITFEDPNPPVGAAGGGADAAGAGGGAGGQSGDATAAAANPLTDISFVGLSNGDIFRRSFYVKYAIEGIMEAEGKDEDKEKAIKSLINEMKITTQTQFANQNASYQNHIKTNTDIKNKEEQNQKIINLKTIGAELLRRVANEQTETFLMSDPAMEKIYKDTGQTPIINRLKVVPPATAVGGAGDPAAAAGVGPGPAAARLAGSAVDGAVGGAAAAAPAKSTAAAAAVAAVDAAAVLGSGPASP